MPLPEDAEFKEIADKLGGFQRPYRIPVEKDATVPRLYSGFQMLKYELATDSMAGDSPSVDIQRPDTVGRSGNIGFYLSDAYGLILVSIDPYNPLDSKTGCTMALPGRPKNFIVKDDTLIAIISSRDGYNSGLIQFSIEKNQLTYVHSLFFENQRILDARLFNQTLALYTVDYEFANDQDAVSNSDSPNASIAMDDSMYRPRTMKSNQLMVLDIVPELNFKNTDVFWPEDRPEDGNSNRFESHFNSFLSASGEYLIVTESQTEQIFKGYETKYYSVCTNYEKRTQERCRTNWKQIPNPDYVPPTSSGVFTCNGSLLSCLRNIGPKVAKYIYVPDDVTCYDYFSNVCTEREYKSWDYPVYDKKDYSKFYIYRFKDDQFLKLDDTLASVSDDHIEVTENPFRMEGHVQKHDHMMFHDDILYAIAKGQRLNVFTIQRNSPIYVSGLNLGYSEDVSMNVSFTKDKIYISNSPYFSSTSVTEMQTINIENPIDPILETKISIPTNMDQLVFDDNSLIGIGKTKIDMGKDGYYYFGTFTYFTSLGKEINNLILGTDYKYYYHDIAYDDQILTLDRELDRLFLPYSVYNPFDPTMPINANRLTMASFSGDTISELHTLSFTEKPERSLSITNGLAFAFSDHLINMLYLDNVWQTLELFNGEVPSSIYPSKGFPYFIKKYNQNNQYTFLLTDDLSSQEAIDILTVAKATSHYCTRERVYFDNDRILIVSEPPGIYFASNECAGDGTDIKTLTGFRITEKGFEAINGQVELETLYSQIIKDIRCVIDTDNMEGIEIFDFDQIPDEATCYTAKEYNEIIWNDQDL